MAKDYFKECKAIIDSILANMSKTEDYDDSRYYTIDILNVDGERAKVMVCDNCQYLTKEEGSWIVTGDASLSKEAA